MNPQHFAAIDFETANNDRHSACAVAVVVVKNNQITKTVERLIRPPSRRFLFTHIHGLTWHDVHEAPSFDEVWDDILPLVDGVDFIAAHNASFDRSVLRACCEKTARVPPSTPFLCTVQHARKVLNLPRYRLPDVSKALDIRLDRHHDALNDALACANIVMRLHEKAPAEPFIFLRESRKRRRSSQPDSRLKNQENLS